MSKQVQPTRATITIHVKQKLDQPIGNRFGVLPISHHALVIGKREYGQALRRVVWLDCGLKQFRAFISSHTLRIRLVMMLEPILQLGSALGRFGSNVGRIATSLTVFNLPMHRHYIGPVILNITGDGHYLGLCQIQYGGNIRL